MKGSLCTSFLLSLLPGLILFGCSSTDETKRLAEMVRQNSALQQSNSRLTAELSAQNTANANLRVRLIEKEAEIRRLASMQQGLSREMVRNKAKIHIPKTKAEAVALLAEAETDVNAARESGENSGRQQAFTKPDQLMTESRAALDQGNYDEACSLAAQALELIQTVQLEGVIRGKPQEGPDSDFLSSLSITVSKKSKIREQPDRQAPIAHSLDKGTRVTATGHRGHWIKVTTEDGRTGWIYYTLLTVPEK